MVQVYTTVQHWIFAFFSCSCQLKAGRVWPVLLLMDFHMPGGVMAGVVHGSETKRKHLSSTHSPIFNELCHSLIACYLFSTSVLRQVNGQVCGPVPLLVAFHKPKGIITTVSDDWDREDLSDVLPKSLLLK